MLTRVGIFISLIFISISAYSQNAIRPFTVIYAENLHGGTAMFGNTLMSIQDLGQVNLEKMNESGDPNNLFGGIGFSQYGNDGENMQFVDVDGLASTSNSSVAELTLPAGTNTIKFARLYWGGRINTSILTAVPDSIQHVKLRKGTTGAYSDIYTSASNVDQFEITPTETVYQANIDITSFIVNNGGGKYSVADVPATPGATPNGGEFAGWTIVVAYENLAEPYNTIRVYDGYAQVFNSGTATTLGITLTGLNVPSAPLALNEAILTTMVWEGDANLGSTPTNPAGDFIKINSIPVFNEINPVTNFWNGSISKNGVFVTTKEPDYFNQMGVDIDEVEVGRGYNILPDATSVNIEFGTEADQYFPSLFTFVVRVKDPLVEISKSVTDANNNHFVEPGEELTYILTGDNLGPGISYNTFVADTIPSNVYYIPNSLEVINAPGVTPGLKTDARDADNAFKGTGATNEYVVFYIGNGATGSTGGELPPGATGAYELRFKVKAKRFPATVVNTARIYGYNSFGDLFTDDGTAIIGPAGGPVPVRLISLNAAFSNAVSTRVTWITELEGGTAYYDIERSNDGVHFVKAGRKNTTDPGVQRHTYVYSDQVGEGAAVVYYRLRITDMDGNYSYSYIVAARKGKTSDHLTVYPNPFTDNIKLLLTSDNDDNATIHILSMDGRPLMTRNVSVRKGENIIVLNNLEQLAAGSYMVEVVLGGDKIIKTVFKK